MATKTKKCIGCRKQKTLDKFNKNQKNPDGFQYYCKTCQSEQFKSYYKRNKKHEKLRKKNWYKKNKARLVIKAADYYEKKKGKVFDKVTKC